MTPEYLDLKTEVVKLMGRVSYHVDEPGWQHLEREVVRAIRSANTAMHNQNYTALVLARDELRAVVR
jgi:hypothetical protein